jgi:hypothetical protein
MSQYNSSQELSQDETCPEMSQDETIGAMLTTEAQLRAWYLASRPTLRRYGLSLGVTLYREMQRDLRDFDATVAIIPVPNDRDEMNSMIEEFFLTSAIRNQTKHRPRSSNVSPCQYLRGHFNLWP